MMTFPVFTEDEVEDNDALIVRAKSDGDEQSVNLYLKKPDCSPEGTKATSDLPTQTAMAADSTRDSSDNLPRRLGS